ncbi:hypothetical protein CEXT_638061 [Caerostris extrusa]|uniref:Uncharacterized protein n=1 Tax=Caerostris extrusa TaxID=172846 RepID=A0AAV4RQA5_CAEEX|nr:hypothetical protein CEXT_638061 [Caerostris extrusa]
MSTRTRVWVEQERSFIHHQSHYTAIKASDELFPLPEQLLAQTDSNQPLLLSRQAPSIHHRQSRFTCLCSFPFLAPALSLSCKAHTKAQRKVIYRGHCF